MNRPLFDPGLQPERTELAWRRTLLSFVVGAAALLRLGQAGSGTAALGVALAGLAGAVALGSLVRARFRGVHRALAAGAGTRAGGRSLLLLAAAASALGVTGLVLAITGG